MRKKYGLAVAVVCVACAVPIGGCALEDGEPIPQAESGFDLIPDEDKQSSASSALTAEDGPDSNGSEDITYIAGYRYDRAKAASYISRYALNPNRQLAYCALYDGTAADCTNFASQVLWYGGVPMKYTNSPETGWWYRYSCLSPGSSNSWKQVNRLLQYLITETSVGELRRSARELQVGDLIFYRIRYPENGYSCDGNLFNHTTVVSGFDGNGEPLVSYHSNEAHNVPWNAKNGSMKALGEACAFAFVHIRD